MVPAIWKDLSRGLKAFGISLAALGAVTQFWYQSVYVPENTPTGMEYSFSVGPPVQSSLGRIVQVHVTMEDPGSVPNVVLASMVVVREVEYVKKPADRGSGTGGHNYGHFPPDKQWQLFCSLTRRTLSIVLK